MRMGGTQLAQPTVAAGPEPAGKPSPWMDEFWVRRLHELLGLVPIGAFLVFHLYENSRVIQGPAVYNRLIVYLEHLPYLVFIEIFGLFIPILLHAAIGFYIIFTPQMNVNRYPYARNWNFYLQRVTGVIAFIFITYHVITLRLIPGMEGTHATFQLLQSQLHQTWILILYLVGVVGTIYHFSNGLWSAMVHWGITVGPRAQRNMGMVAVLVFVLLTAMAVRAILVLAA